MPLLKEYIKKAVRDKLAIEKQKQVQKEKSIYLIYKFPGLHQVFVDLMSPAFPRFIMSVEITAPKPTTFRITLINGMSFIVYYANRKEFMAKILGKKYWMDNLSDIERASQVISNVLQLNYNQDEAAKQKAAGEENKAADLKASLDGGGGGGGGSIGGDSGGFPGGPDMDPGGPGIDPNAPADASLGNGETDPNLAGAEGGEEEPKPDEEKPKEPEK